MSESSEKALSLFVDAGGASSEHAISELTRVGRDSKLEVRIAHPHVSRHHFTVHRNGEGLTLEHMHKPDNNPKGSWVTTCTFINGAQVKTRAPLSEGDVITLKEDEELNQVTIRVGPSVNPAVKATGGDKPWWKIW